MTLPYLVLDCYYDDRGAAPNFLALLGEREARVVRCVYEHPPQQLDGLAGIFVTGSKSSLTAPEPWMEALLDTLRAAHAAGIPTLGICFGHQALARALFGKDAVRPAETTELGWVEIECVGDDPLLASLPERFPCFASHFDEVTPGIPELELLARSERCPVAGYRVRGTRTWALQFHPEMDPGESETLVRNNLARHVQLPQDVEATLARRVDGRVWGAPIFEEFMRRAEAWAKAPTR